MGVRVTRDVQTPDMMRCKKNVFEQEFYQEDVKKRLKINVGLVSVSQRQNKKVRIVIVRVKLCISKNSFR
jgi:hypothetical protein